MLSYRHGFHAGNYADVLKHFVLVQILDYLGQKDKPLCYIETHAGAGHYTLDSEFALKNREFAGGIEKIWQHKDLPAALAHYVAIIKHFNPNGILKQYPGSPLIAQHLLRKQDHLFLHELHGTEIKALKGRFRKDPSVSVFHADGLKHSLGLLPPSQRRGLVLIDPSYEDKGEYRWVVDTLVAMTKRFASGTYALWYPVVERGRNQKLEKSLLATGIKNIQLFELGLQPDSDEHGMTASGMIVINPPWTLLSNLQQTLPWLAQQLGDAEQGHYRCEVLAAE